MILSSLQEFYAALISTTPIIGIDYGGKKIGSAISNPDKTMSMPLEVVAFKNDANKLDYIASIAKKYNACGIVIGLPINMDGTDSLQTKIVYKFAEKLSLISNLPIFLQDERLSSFEAQSILISAGIKRKDRDRIDDKIAASLILNCVIEAFKRY